MVAKTFEDAFDQTVAELRSLMLAKQRDYGHDNILAFGLLGVLVRMSDKVARLRNLWRKGRLESPENESVDDTLKDIANYAIIGLMLRRGVFTRPLAEELEARLRQLELPFDAPEKG